MCPSLVGLDRYLHCENKTHLLLLEKLVCSQLAGGGEVPATLVDKHQGTEKIAHTKKRKSKNHLKSVWLQ